MRFQSANRSYTVLPRDVQRDNYGRKIGDIRGLKAEFGGRSLPLVFDSVEAQKANRWTDEERIQVERFLLSDPSFGYTKTIDGGGTLDRQIGNITIYELYLASGETVPEEHLDFVREQRWWQIENPADAEQIKAKPEIVDEAERCIWTGPNPEDDDETIACARKAMKDGLYCKQHAKVSV